MLGITLHLYLMHVTHWCILVLYVNRQPRRGRQPHMLDSTLVPEHIWHSVSVEFVESHDCTAKNGIVYDYALCVLCRLNGYVVAILSVKRALTSSDVAQMFVERVFVHFGFPAAIYSDWSKLIYAEFCKGAFKLTGIDEYKRPVYRPKSNECAENAVQLVVNSVRKLLNQKHSRDWVQLFGLALWSLNDTPGRIAGYSSYRLIFGRHPIGFGDGPPILPRSECQKAVDFFRDSTVDREGVQKRLSAIHKREMERYRAKHPQQVFKPGEKVWVKVKRDGLDKEATKLSRLWKGPVEILRHVGYCRYRVHTEKGERCITPWT